jgi:potassium efflux system protein
LKVAQEHPKITVDPAPLATLESFSANSNDLILRCYLDGFADRLQVINELHVAISKAFAEAGVEIAIPQVDLLRRRSKDFPVGPADAPAV